MTSSTPSAGPTARMARRAPGWGLHAAASREELLGLLGGPGHSLWVSSSGYHGQGKEGNCHCLWEWLCPYCILKVLWVILMPNEMNILNEPLGNSHGRRFFSSLLCSNGHEDRDQKHSPPWSPWFDDLLGHMVGWQPPWSPHLPPPGWIRHMLLWSQRETCAHHFPPEAGPPCLSPSPRPYSRRAEALINSFLHPSAQHIAWHTPILSEGTGCLATDDGWVGGGWVDRWTTGWMSRWGHGRTEWQKLKNTEAYQRAAKYSYS